MPTIRKLTTVHKIRLPTGEEIGLTDEEARALADALIARYLVGPNNLRRLAFGDEALERQGIRPFTTKRAR